MSSEPTDPEVIEKIARELHDTVFAFNFSMPPWNNLDEEKREWFRHRANRLVEYVQGGD